MDHREVAMDDVCFECWTFNIITCTEKKTCPGKKLELDRLKTCPNEKCRMMNMSKYNVEI